MTNLPAAFLQAPIAHRALHDTTDGRPENSRAAIRAAIAAGYGIEIDVQLSADGQAMVFHDYDLGRLTGANGFLHDFSARDLGEIKLKYGTEGIPTLADVLALVDGQVPLLIEIKDQDGALGNNTGALEQAVADAVRNYQGDVAVMSFNPNAIAAFGQAAPNVARGLVTGDFRASDWLPVPASRRKDLRLISRFDEIGSSFVSHSARDLDSTPIAELKARGVPVLCWTIRSETAEQDARRIADNVTFEGYLARHPA